MSEVVIWSALIAEHHVTTDVIRYHLSSYLSLVSWSSYSKI